MGVMRSRDVFEWEFTNPVGVRLVCVRQFRKQQRALESSAVGCRTLHEVTKNVETSLVLIKAKK